MKLQLHVLAHALDQLVDRLVRHVTAVRAQHAGVAARDLLVLGREQRARQRQHRLGSLRQAARRGIARRRVVAAERLDQRLDRGRAAAGGQPLHRELLRRDVLRLRERAERLRERLGDARAAQRVDRGLRDREVVAVGVFDQRLDHLLGAARLALRDDPAQAGDRGEPDRPRLLGIGVLERAATASTAARGSR